MTEVLTQEEEKLPPLLPGRFLVLDKETGVKTPMFSVDVAERFWSRWGNMDPIHRQQPEALAFNRRARERFGFAPEQHASVATSEPGQDSLAEALAARCLCDAEEIAAMKQWRARTPAEHQAAARAKANAEAEARERAEQAQAQASMLAQALREALGLPDGKPAEPKQPLEEPESEQAPPAAPDASPEEPPPPAAQEEPERPKGPFGGLELPPGLRWP